MSDLGRRAARGIRALIGRQVLIQLVTFGAGIALARALTPAQFGLYFIASFFVATFAIFGDFGFGPSLIQQRDDLRPHDLRVAFTLQLAATTLLVAVLMLVARWLVLLYPHASNAVVWLIRALALQLYLTAFRSLSVLQLERALHYGRVAAIEVCEATVYSAVAVALALAGLGVWSLAIAVLARACVGAGIAYVMAPWRVGLAYDRPTAQRLLKFGLPFQFTGLIQQAGGWLTPVLVGSMLGAAPVGLLTWASSNARKPLMAVESVARVALPHFSRIQDDRREVERVLGRYLHWLLLGSSLWLAAILVSAPGLVPAVYGHKWDSAVPALIVFAGALCVDVVAWLLGTTLFGIGKVAVVARANVYRVVVYVGLGVTLVVTVGFIGAAVAALVSVVATLPVLLRAFGAGSARRILMPLVPTAFPSCAGLTAGLAVRLAPAAEPLKSFVAGAACVVIFALVAVLLRLVPLRKSQGRFADTETLGREAAA